MRGMKMKAFGKYLGVFAGLATIILWAILIFFNPYRSIALSGETFAIIFTMILFPALIAIISVILNKPFFMLGAFVWALPYSLYFMLTPSIFKLFGVTCFLYLVSFLILYLYNRNRRGAKLVIEKS